MTWQIRIRMVLLESAPIGAFFGPLTSGGAMAVTENKVSTNLATEPGGERHIPRHSKRGGRTQTGKPGQ